MRRHIESNEQRDGRGERQGNEVYGPVFDTAGTLIDPGQGIRIFLYVTARSFDGYVWVRHVSPKPCSALRIGNLAVGRVRPWATTLYRRLDQATYSRRVSRVRQVG
jgi:hypothetical protein